MDFKQIQELIKMVDESNIGEITIEQKEFKLTIKQKEEHFIQSYAVSAPTPQMPYQAPAAALPQAPAAPAASQAAPAEASKTAGNLITIKSPMIGTFYRRPSPDKPNFIEIGDEISPGKVVCIIEAMKLFNEIEAEVKGRIVKILVEDSSPVEYDQPLFMIEPA